MSLSTSPSLYDIIHGNLVNGYRDSTLIGVTSYRILLRSFSYSNLALIMCKIVITTVHHRIEEKVKSLNIHEKYFL